MKKITLSQLQPYQRPVSKAKLKLYTPAVMALNTVQLKALADPPARALKRFKEGSATSTNWYELLFRCTVCFKTAKTFYSEENASEIHPAVLCLEEMAKTRIWTLTPEQQDLIESVLEAMCQMDRDITRSLLIPIYKKVYVSLKTTYKL